MTGIEQWLLPRLGIKSPPWTIHRTQGRSPLPEAGGRVQADRLPEARRQAHLRPPLERLRQQHQPRRGPAAAPDAEGRERAGEDQPGEVRRPREPLLPGRGLRVRRTTTAPSGCRSTPRTASTARPATSRTRRRTSSGSRPKAAAGPTTSACERGPECPSSSTPPATRPADAPEVLTAARLWPPMMEALRGAFRVHDRTHQKTRRPSPPPRRASARSPRAASRRCRAS